MYNDTIVLCAQFQNDGATDMGVMYKRDFVSSEAGYQLCRINRLLFTKRTDVLTQDLAKSRSREIQA